METNVSDREHRTKAGTGPAAGAVLLAFLLLMAGALAGCGGEEEAASSGPDTEKRSRYTVAFVDQSVSTGRDSAAMTVFRDTLTRVIESRMTRPGDKIRLYAVHEKTASKAFRTQMENTAEPPEEKEFESEQVMAQARHEAETQRQISKAAAGAQQFLEDLGKQETFTAWTDLWGTIPILHDERRRAGTARGTTAVAYYLSDMYESMGGRDRRNFEKRRPSSTKTAETWARRDADRIRTYYNVPRRPLDGVSIRVIPGREAARSGARAVEAYWTQLFRELGAEKVTYNP
jgi:hypothetical protein